MKKKSSNAQVAKFEADSEEWEKTLSVDNADDSRFGINGT